MPKAKNLKYCRKKHHLTQEQLADKLGVTRATIVSWETKKHAITEPNAQRIADFFGVDYSDFCDEDFEIIARNAANGKVVLTEGEEQTVLMFRSLPPELKRVIKNAILFAYKEEMENEMS